MKTQLKPAWLVTLAALALLFWTGCESDSGSRSSSTVSGSMYYGVGFYDPWYYGGYYYDDPDISVTPPDRPDRPEIGGPRPENPIARPPEVAPKPTPRTSTRSSPSVSARPAPSARPTPSMPSMPRGGGGRRR